jgi:hypothetical protein
MSREQQVRAIVDRFLSRVRQDLDHRLAMLGTELLDAVSGSGDAGRVAIERAAVDVARAVARGGGHARHDLITRVITAIRRLDEATTLRGILDALAEGASAETDAAAMFIVDAGQLQTYRHQGFEPGRAPIDVPVEKSPLLNNVVTFRQAAVVPAAGLHADVQLPAFMRVSPGRVGLAMPLVVGKDVVALLYAEGPERAAGEPGEPVWTEQVEVLVRHAGARLENVTANSLRTVEVLSTS